MNGALHEKNLGKKKSSLCFLSWTLFFFSIEREVASYCTHKIDYGYFKLCIYFFFFHVRRVTVSFLSCINLFFFAANLSLSQRTKTKVSSASDNEAWLISEVFFFFPGGVVWQWYAKEKWYNSVLRWRCTIIQYVVTCTYNDTYELRLFSYRLSRILSSLFRFRFFQFLKFLLMYLSAVH